MSKENRERIENTLGISEAASLLHVSSATIRNWIKGGWVQAIIKEGKKGLYVNDIQQLQTLSSERLRQRANKAHSEKSFLPKEYLQNKTQLQEFTAITTYIQEQGISTSTALFLLTLNLLQKEKMVDVFSLQDIPDKKLRFKHQSLELEINNWIASLSNFTIESNYSYLLQCSIPLQKDVLGLFYQSLMKEGTKAQQGAYYTPEKIVIDIVETYVKNDSKVLDPCCGTGQFLLAFAQKVKHPDLIYGIDIDELAVRIARINLMLVFKDLEFIPNIVCQNALFDAYSFDNFDIVASNPPWGFHFSESEKETISKLYPEITSMESFSFFLKESLDVTATGGVVSFILPESILKVNIHKDIRSILLHQTQIVKIKYLDRIFKNVFSPIIRFDIKNDPTSCQKTEIEINNRNFAVDSSVWKATTNYVFAIHSNEYDLALLQKIYSIQHTTLYKQADWILGIVTGNNKVYLSKVNQNGFVPIYKGSDVMPLYFKEASHFLHFVPEKFQQMAPLEKFKAKEKLIYRFISKKLVVAYDDQQRFPLNSANCVISQIPNYSMKIIALLFNSSLYQYIFQKKFASIKVLRSHLEQLPLPVLNVESYQQLENLYIGFSQGKKLQKEIDFYVMSLFGLSKEEQSYILESI